MNTSMIILLAVLFIALAAFLAWRNANRATAHNPTTVTITGATGLTMAACSFAMSVLMGWSLAGNDSLLSIVFPVLFGCVCIGEFVASYWLEDTAHKQQAVKFLGGLFILIVGIVFSIGAGQMLIGDQVAQEKLDKLRASDTYQTAKQARENALHRAEQMAVSESTYQQARATQQATQRELSAYLAGSTANSEGRNIGAVSSVISRYGCGGYYAGLCAERDRLQAKINNTQRTISAYEAYTGALDHATTLNAQELPDAASEQVHKQFIIWIANLTNSKPENVEAVIFPALAVIFELFAIILLFLYGSAKRANAPVPGDNVSHHDTKEDMPPAGVDRTKEPIPALDTGAKITSDGYAYLHEGERVLNLEETAAYETWLVQRQNDGATAEKAGNPGDSATAYTGPVDTGPVEERKPGDFMPCEYQPCADQGGGYVIKKGTPSNKRFCSTRCRMAHHNTTEVEIKRNVSRARNRQKKA